MYLGWLIAPRTSSSNSIGPGMSSAGCGACLDVDMTEDFGASSGVVCSDNGGVSTSRWAERSVEKGVFNSRKGFEEEERCLEIRLKRALEVDGGGREGARVDVTEDLRNGRREKTVLMVVDSSRRGAARVPVAVSSAR